MIEGQGSEVGDGKGLWTETGREGGLGCCGAREVEGLRGSRCASLPDPSPSRTRGPRDGQAPSGEGEAVGKRVVLLPGAGACGVLFGGPRACRRAPWARGGLFARLAAAIRRQHPAPIPEPLCSLSEENGVGITVRCRDASGGCSWAAAELLGARDRNAARGEAEASKLVRKFSVTFGV